MAPLKQGLGALLFTGAVSAAQYSQYILTPNSRTIYPTSVYHVNGTVTNASSVLGEGQGSAIFNGPSAVTYDFGKNIGGVVTLRIGDVDEDQFIGLAYTESSLWISSEGSDATADAGLDEILWFRPTGPGNFTVSREHERGGFRYLSLIHNTTAGIEVESVSVYFTPMPHIAEDQLGNYTGYFHCNDELVNRIWYAGAYTNEMCTIDPHHGNSLIHLGTINSTMLGNETAPNTWYNNYTIANGSSVLTDGAKRDRLVWPGDIAISMPSSAVSTYDLVTSANSINSLYLLQNMTTGQMPYAGVPFSTQLGNPLSFTYHLYNLIILFDYYLYAGDLSYVENKWDQYKLALAFSLSFIDESGMQNVTSSADWLRFGMGGHNIEANSILYFTINQAVYLASEVNESNQTLVDSWQSAAAGIKAAANKLLWNETAGLYHDNETTTLMPQDGNCWAVISNLTDSAEKNVAISNGLAARWTDFGAPAPEADNAVSPFISGFELEAHFIAGSASTALALVRLEWGFMINDPRMTNSTFIEGYQADGVLHYAPYTNDPRVSHAHGWATGPTSHLTEYFAGIRILTQAGETWEIAPALGGLTSVDAGYSTNLGLFANQVNATEEGAITGMTFTTPSGTTGTVRLPGVSGSLTSSNGTIVQLSGGIASNVAGGSWTLNVQSSTAVNGTTAGGNSTYGVGSNGTGTASSPSATGSQPAQYTGNSATMATISTGLLALAASVFAFVL